MEIIIGLLEVLEFSLNSFKFLGEIFKISCSESDVDRDVAVVHLSFDCDDFILGVAGVIESLIEDTLDVLQIVQHLFHVLDLTCLLLLLVDVVEILSQFGELLSVLVQSSLKSLEVGSLLVDLLPHFPVVSFFVRL